MAITRNGGIFDDTKCLDIPLISDMICILRGGGVGQISYEYLFRHYCLLLPGEYVIMYSMYRILYYIMLY